MLVDNLDSATRNSMVGLTKFNNSFLESTLFKTTTRRGVSELEQEIKQRHVD